MGIGHRIRFYIEYSLARAMFGFLGRLPPALGRPVGAWLGRTTAMALVGRHRMALANMRRAFPDMGERQRVFLARRMWAGLGQWLWELARFARMTPADYERAVRVDGIEKLKASQARGKGVLVFTAHCGQWEYIPVCITRAGLPLAMIARRTKNPWVNTYLTAMRERFGATLLLHKQAVRESLKRLKAGHVLGLLFDQRITDGGVTAPFFGVPARTTALPALLALRTGCPVHPIVSWREGGLIRIKIFDALAIEPGPPTADRILQVTTLLNSVVESWVRDSPDQWLWIHNRWKP